MSTEKSHKSFALKDFTEILVKHEGHHEGIFELTFEFTFGAGLIGPSLEDRLPGVIVGIKSFGLSRTTEPGPHTVDAAVVNPVSAKKRGRAKDDTPK